MTLGAQIGKESSPKWEAELGVKYQMPDLREYSMSYETAEGLRACRVANECPRASSRQVSPYIVLKGRCTMQVENGRASGAHLLGKGNARNSTSFAVPKQISVNEERDCYLGTKGYRHTTPRKQHLRST
jgi:hypothetical protein